MKNPQHTLLGDFSYVSTNEGFEPKVPVSFAEGGTNTVDLDRAKQGRSGSYRESKLLCLRVGIEHRNYVSSALLFFHLIW